MTLRPPACEDLFMAFDKDKSGSLKGAEFEGLKKEAVKYTMAEFKGKGLDKTFIVDLND